MWRWSYSRNERQWPSGWAHTQAGMRTNSHTHTNTRIYIAGENEQVRRALREPPIKGRGLRVLAMDGGGMKGLAMVTMLKGLEQRLGRPVHSVFDVVVGGRGGAWCEKHVTQVLCMCARACARVCVWWWLLLDFCHHVWSGAEKEGLCLERLSALGICNLQPCAFGALITLRHNTNN